MKFIPNKIRSTIIRFEELWVLIFCKFSLRTGRAYSDRFRRLPIYPTLPKRMLNHAISALISENYDQFQALISELLFYLYRKPSKHCDYSIAMLSSGIGFLLENEFERASERLAKGFGSKTNKIFSRISTYGFPQEIFEWAITHQNKLASKRGWDEIFERHSSTEDIQRIIIFVIAATRVIQKSNPMSKVLFEKLWPTSNFSYLYLERLLFSSKRNPYIFTSKILESLNLTELKAAVTNNMILRLDEFERTDQISTKEPKKFLTKQEHALIAKHKSLLHLSEIETNLLMSAVSALASSKYNQAKVFLSLLTNSQKQILENLLKQKSARKVFIAGFGWSGSGAIHDSLSGFPNVKDMPGSGKLEFLNDDADTEPMLHQGPGGLSSLEKLKSSSQTAKVRILRNFARLYILSGPHHSYFEYKTIGYSTQLRNKIGLKLYNAIIGQLLWDLCEALQRNNRKRIEFAISQFEHRIFNALFENKATVVLYNNAINAQNLYLLKYIQGDIEYIAVDRDTRDQFVDQRQLNGFFGDTALTFSIKKAQKLKKFERAYNKLKRRNRRMEQNLKIRTISFEDWVTDDNFRAEICEEIFGKYDEKYALSKFDPKVSKNNISIHNGQLRPFESFVLNRAKWFSSFLIL